MTRLLAITPGRADVADLRRAEALGDAGIDGVLVREPDLAAGDVAAWLDALRARVPWVIVHGRCAGLHNAPVHRSSTDLRPGDGRSCHSFEALDAAFASGSSWATLSPVWPTKVSDARVPLGPDLCLRWAGGRPVYLLGGVTQAQADSLRGAYGIAAIGAFFGEGGLAAVGAFRRALQVQV